MKKLLLLTLTLAYTLGMSADKNFLNHLSIGVNAGTPGIGFDIGAPLCKVVQLRAGAYFFPSIKYNTILEFGDVSIAQRNALAYYDAEELADEIEDFSELDVTGKLKMVQGKVLFDIFPTPKTIFHFTVGAYFGAQSPLSVFNAEDGALSVALKGNDYINRYNKEHNEDTSLFGLELSDYTLTPDENGNAQAELRVWKAKPYVGFGVGRAVPKKRIGCMFEVGAMFWGHPTVWCNDLQLTKEEVGHNEEAFDIVNKITVYPVISLRLCGRLF